MEECLTVKNNWELFTGDDVAEFARITGACSDFSYG